MGLLYHNSDTLIADSQDGDRACLEVGVDECCAVTADGCASLHSADGIDADRCAARSDLSPRSSVGFAIRPH